MEVSRIQHHRKRKQKVSQARAEIIIRYNQCDSQGHKNPDSKNNYCNHCFRHLSYQVPQIYASDPIQREQELNLQKQSDYLEGLGKLERRI